MKGGLYNDKKVCGWRSSPGPFISSSVSLGARVSVYKRKARADARENVQSASRLLLLGTTFTFKPWYKFYFSLVQVLIILVQVLAHLGTSST